ncbi:hypothetical protein BDW68DRAFT_171113 [Aspergillus falconensis]
MTGVCAIAVRTISPIGPARLCWLVGVLMISGFIESTLSLLSPHFVAAPCTAITLALTDIRYTGKPLLRGGGLCGELGMFEKVCCGRARKAPFRVW